MTRLYIYGKTTNLKTDSKTDIINAITLITNQN